MTWTAEYDPELQLEGHHLVVAMLGDLVLQSDGTLIHRYHCLSRAASRLAFSTHIGSWRGQPCFAVSFQPQAKTLLADFKPVALRSQLGLVDDEEFLLAGRAQQLDYWWDLHRFCGRCGGATSLHARERAKHCTTCDLVHYPRISPCIMAIVLRGDRCLLAHHTRAASGVYSVLAGFIEPGETAEQAVVREVQEEVGLQVAQLRYVSSQAWPFPSQLMLAYVAYSCEGDIRVDGEEIDHADWFRAGHLPQTPSQKSLSGRLIRMFEQGQFNGIT